MTYYSQIATLLDRIFNGNIAANIPQMASAMKLSESHFRQIFKDYVGISPKRFCQFIRLRQTQTLLDQEKPLLEISEQIDLSSPSRLQDLYKSITAMTPDHWRRKGAGLILETCPIQTILGSCLIATSDLGICFLGFATENHPFEAVYQELQKQFSEAQFQENLSKKSELEQQIHLYLTQKKRPKVHLIGTNFQLKIWQALLEIPEGDFTNYQQVSKFIDNPKAQRAVGHAIGQNPISLLIPCHRVITKSGLIHNYRWGTAQKEKLLHLEQIYKDTL